MAESMTLERVLNRHRDAILEIAGRYGATNIRVFGSVARSEARPDSDVDFLIDLTRPWSLFDRIGMKQELEDLLGCRVDLVVADSLRELVRDQTLADAVAL